MGGQDILDKAFDVTPEEREVLRRGKIPWAIRRRLRFMARSPFSGSASSLILVFAVLAGVTLGLGGLPNRDVRSAGLLAAFALPIGVMLWVRLRDWLHA